MRGKETRPIVQTTGDVYAQSVDIARDAQAMTENDTSGVGAVLWKDVGNKLHRVAVEANRFPAGLSRAPIRYKNGYFSDFDLHAEEGAITAAAKSGQSTTGTVCTTTHCPCFECTTMLIEAGVKQVIIDGAQKLRPNWFKKWLPQGQRTLQMLKHASIDVQVHDLRLTEDGWPDLQMSEEEAAGAGERRYALSKEGSSLSPPEGTIVYERFVYFQPPPPERQPDDCLNMPVFRGGTEQASPQMNLLHRKALKAIDASPELFPRQAAILFNDRRPTAPLHIEVARPPRGSEKKVHSRQDALAWSMPAEHLLVAHAARDGYAMQGKSVYLTHFPTNRSAILLAGAGIRSVYIDSRNVPASLSPEHAAKFWKAYVAFREAGVEVHFPYQQPGIDVMDRIRQAVPEHVREDIKITPHQPLRGATSHAEGVLSRRGDARRGLGG